MYYKIIKIWRLNVLNWGIKWRQIIIVIIIVIVVIIVLNAFECLFVYKNMFHYCNRSAHADLASCRLSVRVWQSALHHMGAKWAGKESDWPAFAGIMPYHIPFKFKALLLDPWGKHLCIYLLWVINSVNKSCMTRKCNGECSLFYQLVATWNLIITLSMLTSL